jgi:hypothetical protein
MESVKRIAKCIGLSGNFSIVKDFYGYRTGAPKQLSLLTQIPLLQGRYINLNLIRVETVGVSIDQQRQIDIALQFMRDTYASVYLGVGLIQRFVIPPKHEIIDDSSEAKDLLNEWAVPNNGIDVFLVRYIDGDSLGKSPTPGSCDKESKNDSGVVIGIEDSGRRLGTTFAHEIGHYLGLKHEEDDRNNLMYPTSPNGGQLTRSQGSKMQSHCIPRPGCKARKGSKKKGPK